MGYERARLVKTGRYLAELAGTGLVYFALAKFGLALASAHPSSTPVWPPTGFALAMVLLLGPRVWPAIFAGALIANYTTAGSFMTSVAIALGNTLEATVGSHLIGRWSGGIQAFETPWRVTKFALSVAPAAFISATIGVSALQIGGFLKPDLLSTVWITWWMGDFTGGLLFTPVIVLWAAPGARMYRALELWETAGLIAAASAVGLLVFSPLVAAASERAPLAFLAMVPLLWSAFRRGQRDTATVGLLLAVFAIWGAAAGGGPSASIGVNNALMLVSMFVIGAAFPSLVLSAEVALRQKAEDQLRESEARFRGIYEHTATGIAITGLEARLQSCNPAYASMLNYTEEELRGANLLDILHPEDREAYILQIHRLLEEKTTSFEILNRYISKRGKTVWVHKHVSLLPDVAGKPAGIVALVTDITERKRYEEQIGLLMREVDHRSKNMLTLVLALARRTVATRPEDFIGRFGERIQALAASQELLIKNEWRGALLEELFFSRLGHLQDLFGSRIEMHGPPLFITAPAAQAIGMALHELATNAGKYGALSNADGRVEVRWSLERRGAREPAFSMSWRERGGPPVETPGQQGFGSTVITRMVSESLRGEVKLDFEAGGLSWWFRCPAVEVVEGFSFGTRAHAMA